MICRSIVTRNTKRPAIKTNNEIYVCFERIFPLQRPAQDLLHQVTSYYMYNYKAYTDTLNHKPLSGFSKLKHNAFTINQTDSINRVMWIGTAHFSISLYISNQNDSNRLTISSS